MLNLMLSFRAWTGTAACLQSQTSVTVLPEWTSVHLQPKVSKDVSLSTKLSQSSEKWGGRRERQKCRHAKAKRSDSPILERKSEKRFFFSGAASVHGLLSCPFALIRFLHVHFFEKKYIYICNVCIGVIYIYTFNCFMVYTLVFTSVLMRKATRVGKEWRSELE